MYKYRIGYVDFEDCGSVQLEHDQKFTEQDITIMIAEAIKDLYPEVVNHNNGHFDEFTEFFNGRWYSDKDVSCITGWLVKNKGFRYVEYEVDWCVSNGSVTNDTRWICGEKETPLEHIRQFLLANGIKKNV